MPIKMQTPFIIPFIAETGMELKVFKQWPFRQITDHLLKEFWGTDPRRHLTQGS